MGACPYRKDFYEKLAADPAGGASAAPANLDGDLNQWLTALDSIVTRVQAFYEAGGYSKGL